MKKVNKEVLKKNRRNSRHHCNSSRFLFLQWNLQESNLGKQIFSLRLYQLS